MKKTIYRTIIHAVVLSEEPIPDGDFCGNSAYIEFNKPISGKDAANAVIRTGSDPDFFKWIMMVMNLMMMKYEKI